MSDQGRGVTAPRNIFSGGNTPPPGPRVVLAPLADAADFQHYQETVMKVIQLLFANKQHLAHIPRMATDHDDMRIWGMMALRELGTIRADCDALIRRLAVDLVLGGYIQQKDAAQLSGFSRGTIATWTRQAEAAQQDTDQPANTHH